MLADALYLALRYVRASPWRTVVLVLGSAVALFLPAFTYLASGRVERALSSRAEASPILVGARGNEFDLTMSSLYFRGQVGATIRYGERRELERRFDAVAVPLYVRYTAGGAALVGTSPEYFEHRRLALASGRRPALLGEVVAGAGIARELRLEPGARLLSDLTNLYNLAGSYPIALEVVGVLEANGTPDDDALLTDVRTTWLIDGRIHGHEPVTREQTLDPEAEEDGNLEATAALFLFNRFRPEARDRFHLHGDEADAPLTALLVFPRGFPRERRAHDQILGDYALDESLQAVRPVEVVGTVLGIVLRVRAALESYFTLVSVSTAAFFGLVVALTLRLRRPELELMRRIGCSRDAIATIVGAEVAVVLVLAVLVAAVASVGGVAFLETRFR